MEGVIVSSLVSFAKHSAARITGEAQGPGPHLYFGLSPAIKQESIIAKLHSKPSQQAASPLSRITSILYIVFWVFIGVSAAMLSWNSNSLIGWGTGYKTVFSTGAFLFPLYYLLLHFIAKYDMIMFIRSHNYKHTVSRK